MCDLVCKAPALSSVEKPVKYTTEKKSDNDNGF